MFHNLAGRHSIAPLVIDLLRPRSILDIGCGVGTWLAAFHEHGIHDIQGIDGPHINRSMIRIPGRRVWTDERVDWWYAQNTLLYASRDLIAARPELQTALDTHGPGAPALVHPKRYLAEADPTQRTVRADLTRLRRTFTLAALRRVRQRFP